MNKVSRTKTITNFKVLDYSHCC